MLRLGDVDDSGEIFNPQRLTLARRKNGLTKIGLAKKLNVDLRAVTAYEAGEYRPAPDVLRKLGVALKVPTSFFFGDDLEELVPDASSFRSMSKRTAAQLNMALGAGAIALHINKWIENNFELPSADLPDLSNEPHPEAAADSVRRYWGLGELPIRNMVHLLEKKGVRVYSLSIGTRQIDAFSMWKEPTPFIFLNNYKSSEHSRYDAAHELGHLVMHRHAAPHGREAERQADAFAASFLMPRASVLAHPVRFPTVDVLRQFKKIWNVSLAALTVRLHEVGQIRDWHYGELFKEISRRGYRTREPDEAPRETSQVLAKVLMSLHKEGISRSDLARTLCILPSELEQLMFGLVMAGIEGGKPRGNDNPPRSDGPNLTLVKG